MALAKIADLYPDYKNEVFGGDDIKDFSVYSDTDEKVGSVYDLLVDETGRFRYLVIDTGFWIFGKKVLLPIGRANIDYNRERIYARGLTKEQAENLPKYDDDMVVDYDYEQRVRSVYGMTATPQSTTYDHNSYSYDNDPSLYGINNQYHGNLSGYQEGLLANRESFRTTDGVGLYKIADLYPDYRNILSNDDLKSYSVYSDNNDKVGSVHDILVDQNGNFRYFVIDTGFWIFGKKVLLPIGRARIDSNQNRVYAVGLTKKQAENLPKYDDDITVDYDYEERVRGIYRTMGDTTLDSSASYAYDSQPELYTTNESNHQKLKLYEERLIANTDRFQAGAVTVGKRVETETAKVSVPIEKERVIIERTGATEARAVAPGEATFNEGEVARIEVYEETADIKKQAFVREEVSVRKEVERDTVSATETIRREELEVKKEGEGIIERDV